MKKSGEINESRKVGRETFSAPKIGNFPLKVGVSGMSETATQKLKTF